ncbi:MAG: TIGR01212 family radical SAM protein [Eubacterium sp.]|nr:TIGR01212 family radical SAM protein [Eubacterium sp.]
MTAFEHWHGKRYHSLDAYIKNTYGEKMYRISINAGMTCPNRDGLIGTGGCIFCSEGGSGDFAPAAFSSITEQIEIGKKNLAKKVNCRHFIAYFQAFTNTYASVAHLRKLYMEAITHPDIKILSIATRPDCLNNEILALLKEINQIKPVWIELGLQTIHEETHQKMNTGFKLSDYEWACNELHKLGIPVITHVIFSLPGENREQMLDTIRYLADRQTDGIKLHMLFVLNHTKLGDYYREHPFYLLTREEYVDLICDALELLPKECIIHRLTGDGPKDLLLEPTWTSNKLVVFNSIQKTMKKRDSYQGIHYKGGNN